MRPAAAATVLLSCLLLAGCGGSGRQQANDDPAPGATLEELWRAPGDDVAVIPGTQNHEPGEVRVSFLVVDAEGAVVALPTARVWVAESLSESPFLETEAKLERIGVPGGDEADATHIYVAKLNLPRAGEYWMLAEPSGGAEPVQALGNVVVVNDDSPPDVDTRLVRRQRLGDHDADASRRVASRALGRRLPRGQGPIRRDLRDAEVLLE
jgi:hypothetical protein